MIGKLRSDSNLRYLFIGPHENWSGRWLTYLGKVKLNTPDGFTRLGVEWFTAVFHHVAFRRNLCVVLVADRAKTRPKCDFFFSTDTDLDTVLILEYYEARFHIEFLFRDARQFAGLQHCQSRNRKALDFHVNAAFCAINFAKAEAATTGANVFSMTSHSPRFQSVLPGSNY